MNFQSRPGDTSTALLVLGLTIIGFALAFFLLSSSKHSIDETQVLLAHGAAERIRNAVMFLAITPGKGYILLDFEVPIFPRFKTEKDPATGAIKKQYFKVAVLDFKNIDKYDEIRTLPSSLLNQKLTVSVETTTQYDQITSWCVIKKTYDRPDFDAGIVPEIQFSVTHADIKARRSGGNPCPPP